MKKMREPEVEAYIGAKIREIRQERGMSQEKLAEHLGVTFQQVQKYEGGKNRIAASTLLTLCNALNVDVKMVLPTQGEEVVTELSAIDPEARRISRLLHGVDRRITRSIIRHIEALAEVSVS